MIQIAIHQSDIEKAKRWSDFQGNSYSITDADISKFCGNLAEVIFSEMYPEAERISHKDLYADFILDGKRIDVKCKARLGYCEDHFEVSVETRQITFDVDEYVFFSYNYTDQVLEYLGSISKAQFLIKAKEWKEGEVDNENGYEVKRDCHNLQIKDLC
jgi:hypothetical protein